MPQTTDTIAAEATPPGRGGVRIVRLSGPGSSKFLSTNFRSLSDVDPSGAPRTAVLGDVISCSGEPIDRCLALFFPTPHSFTGEDVAELHLHGSSGVVRETLYAACSVAGTRPALPGEFSFRAYLNGKLSLLEAEAMNALSYCDTGGQLDMLSRGSVGVLNVELRRIGEGLLEMEAAMEAAIDFSDDIHGRSCETVAEGLESLLASVTGLCDGFKRTRCLSSGWSLALVGATNTGKSSLFNAILRKRRSIVSPLPGTTRDVVTERLDLDGLPLLLSDTAGEQDSDDELDNLGIASANREANAADGLLLVFDSSRGWTREDEAAYRCCPRAPILLVSNKADLPEGATGAPRDIAPLCRTSAHSGEGIGDLLSLISGWMRESLPKGGVAPFSERQHATLKLAAQAISDALADLSAGYTEEVALGRIRAARIHIGEMTGSGDPEALYEAIFSAFCVGK